MNKNHVVALAISVVAVLCVALLAVKFTGNNPAEVTATSADALQDGTHYRTLSNPLATDSQAVSVMEFFWYGCPHCRDFEPKVHEWLKSAPENVNFELKPVAWNDATRLHAAMYFVGLKSTQPEKLHAELFDLIIDMRQERNLAAQIEKSAGLFARYGIDADTLKQSLTAADVSAAVELSEQQMRAAEVASTPTVLVAGRYIVLNNEAVADVGVFNVVNQLIEKARNL